MSHIEQLDAKVADLLQLPAEDRAYIAERLMGSLSPVIDDESLRQYRQRLQELDDGAIAGIPADDVMAEMRSMLDEEYPLPS